MKSSPSGLISQSHFDLFFFYSTVFFSHWYLVWWLQVYPFLLEVWGLWSPHALPGEPGMAWRSLLCRRTFPQGSGLWQFHVLCLPIYLAGFQFSFDFQCPPVALTSHSWSRYALRSGIDITSGVPSFTLSTLSQEDTYLFDTIQSRCPLQTHALFCIAWLLPTFSSYLYNSSIFCSCPCMKGSNSSMYDSSIS